MQNDFDVPTQDWSPVQANRGSKETDHETHSTRVLAIRPTKSFRTNEECLEDNKFVSNKSVSKDEST